MENDIHQQAEYFIKKKILSQERILFLYNLLLPVIGYVCITFWLNSIRSIAPLWAVWMLIVPQFALYFYVFFASYRRSVVCGFNKNLALVLFAILLVLGRVENWEIVVIPVLIIGMIIISSINKNVSDKRKKLVGE